MSGVVPPREVQHLLIADDGAHVMYWRRQQPSSSRGVLLFLHGVASNHTRWSEFLKHSSVSDSWDTVRLDLRGHGQSHLRGAASHERWCDDLRALLDACGYEHAVVVGHSLGANLAVFFAQRYPQRVAGLILIDPVHPHSLSITVPLPVARVVLRALARVVRMGNALGLRRRTVQPLDLEQLDQHARALLAQGRGDEMARLYSSKRQDLKSMPLAGYIQDVVQSLRPLPDFSVAAPVLLLLSVTGDPKGVTMSRDYAARLANCTVVEIRCNHWILTAAPEEARAAIEHWLEGFVTRWTEVCAPVL